jgi:hypothetical protein
MKTAVIHSICTITCINLPNFNLIAQTILILWAKIYNVSNAFPSKFQNFWLHFSWIHKNLYITFRNQAFPIMCLHITGVRRLNNTFIQGDMHGNKHLSTLWTPFLHVHSQSIIFFSRFGWKQSMTTRQTGKMSYHSVNMQSLPMSITSKMADGEYDSQLTLSVLNTYNLLY